MWAGMTKQGGRLCSSYSVTLHPLSQTHLSRWEHHRGFLALSLLAEFCQWKALAKGRRRILGVYSPLISPRLSVVSAMAGGSSSLSAGLSLPAPASLGSVPHSFPCLFRPLVAMASHIFYLWSAPSASVTRPFLKLSPV